MIIVVCGPTGIGKTKLSILLAKKYNGEIINYDAMQVYKHLNIGTAKVTKEEMEGIPHHLIDFKELSDEYNLYNYQQDCREIISNITSRGKNVIMVGGTGLYAKGALYDYKFDSNNTDNKLLYDNVIFIGLTCDRNVLYDRINKRVDIMINNGLISEVKALYNQKIFTKPLTIGIGYKELYQYFEGNITIECAIELIKKNSRNYAKRQYTWYNNKMNVNWFFVDFDNFSNTFEKIVLLIDRV